MPIPRVKKRTFLQVTSIDAPRGRRERERAASSRLIKVLRAIDAPFVSGPAGVARELGRRDEGKRAKSLVNAYVQGFKERITWADLSDTPEEGLVKNIFYDPLTYTPVAAINAILRPLGVVAKAASRAAEGIKGVRAAKFALGGAFIKDFKRGKIFGPEIVAELRKIDRLREERFIQGTVEAEDEIVRVLRQHIKSPKESAIVSELIEEMPLGLEKLELTRVPKEWLRVFNGLSEQARLGTKKAIDIRFDHERQKIAEGFLSDDIAEKFATQYDVRYLKHHSNATKENILEWIDAEQKNLRKGDMDAALRGTDANYSAFREAINRMPASPSPMTRAKFAQQLGEPKQAFQKPRTIPGSIAEQNFRELEVDVGRLLGIEREEIARAVANRDWLERFSAFAKERRFAIEAGRLREAPEEVLRDYMNIVGPKAARDLVKGGFQKVDHPMLEGFVVPKILADDMNRVMGFVSDNGNAMMRFFQGYAKIQNVIKAHLLALFPGYHARNVVTNVSHGFIAGMDPIRDVRILTNDYPMALNFLGRRWRNTPLSDADKALNKTLRMKGVLGAGFIRFEAGSAMLRPLKPRGPLGKLIMPDSNFLIQKGFATGAYFDDLNRLAMFFWRRRKGDAIEDAADFVRKWQYSGINGLTEFEDQMFRNFIFPFYSWYRFNLPLMVEAIVLRPGRVLTFPKAIDYVEDKWGGPAPDEIETAQWMKRLLTVRWRHNDETGESEFLIMNNWHPLADLGLLTGQKEFQKALTGLLSPFVKLPIELFFNWDLWRDQKIEAVPGAKRRFLGIDLPAKAAHLARSVRYLSEADRLLLDSDLDLSPLERGFRLFGLKSYPSDPKMQRKVMKFTYLETVRDAQRQLRRERRRDPQNLQEIRRLEDMIREGKELAKEIR